MTKCTRGGGPAEMSCNHSFLHMYDLLHPEGWVIIRFPTDFVQPLVSSTTEPPGRCIATHNGIGFLIKCIAKKVGMHIMEETVQGHYCITKWNWNAASTPCEEIKDSQVWAFKSEHLYTLVAAKE
ncbi:unnamed protein product [Orchesella dallaii]|uniref:Methyltransferase n=1 Tax=Orchesella dallaii TaxID=48710 RepID=A0ABP1PL02_9HEXA